MVVSGVITAEDSRGQNLADRVVSKLNKELPAEGSIPACSIIQRVQETLRQDRLCSRLGWEADQKAGITMYM